MKKINFKNIMAVISFCVMAQPVLPLFPTPIAEAAGLLAEDKTSKQMPAYSPAAEEKNKASVEKQQDMSDFKTPMPDPNPTDTRPKPKPIDYIGPPIKMPPQDQDPKPIKVANAATPEPAGAVANTALGQAPLPGQPPVPDENPIVSAPCTGNIDLCNQVPPSTPRLESNTNSFQQARNNYKNALARNKKYK